MNVGQAYAGSWEKKFCSGLARGKEVPGSGESYKIKYFDNREVLHNEFQYDFRKGPREISAGTVITVLKAILHVNTVNTVQAEISRGPFRKSYRNSFCKTSLMFLISHG